MAQRNSTQTYTNLNSATCVSPQGHESSPKNDISLLRAQFVSERKVSGEVHKCAEVANQRLVLKNRLEALRCLTRGESAKQLSDVKSLKESDLFELVSAVFASEESAQYPLRELYTLIIKLNDGTWLDEWFVRFGRNEAIVYAQFGAVYPGIRFVKEGDSYRRTGFNFDIRLRDAD